MTFKLYYKKFIDGLSKPVICSHKDDYHVIDFSILKEDTPKSFNPESKRNVEIVKESLLKANGGEVVAYRNCYVGESNITWHFAKSAVIDGVVEF